MIPPSGIRAGFGDLSGRSRLALAVIGWGRGLLAPLGVPGLLDLRSNIWTSDVVGWIGLSSVGLFGKLKRSDRRLGFGATAGLCVVFARGLVVAGAIYGSGDRAAANCAARWEGDFDRAFMSCLGTARLGIVAASSVGTSFRALPCVLCTLLTLPVGDDGPASAPGELPWPCFGLGAFPEGFTLVAAFKAPFAPAYVFEGARGFGGGRPNAFAAPSKAASCESVVPVVFMLP